MKYLESIMYNKRNDKIRCDYKHSDHIVFVIIHMLNPGIYTYFSYGNHNIVNITITWLQKQYMMKMFHRVRIVMPYGPSWSPCTKDEADAFGDILSTTCQTFIFERRGPGGELLY